MKLNQQPSLTRLLFTFAWTIFTLLISHRIGRNSVAAVFNTVNHNVLLSWLHSEFGTCRMAPQWFRSYLNGISHHVKVQENLSQILNLKCSVPQGSCPWPLLFTTHASNLFDVNLPTIHTYVDNTQLYVSLTSSRKNTEQFKGVTAIRNCLDDICNWMTNDKLQLSDNETEFLMIGTKQQLT